MNKERHLLVFGERTFKLTVPEDAAITFGPWSPPKERFGNQEERRGTLRIYRGGSAKTENIIAVFSGVTGFRDLSLDYMEQVAREEGDTLWKSDEKGYIREQKVSQTNHWVKPELPKLVAKNGKRR